MEKALHLRTVNQLKDIDTSRYNRIYIGGDSCPNLLPSISELEEYIKFAESRKLKLTLLTSFCYDTHLDKFREIIPMLQKFSQKLEIEVVINDWGYLGLLKGTDLILSLGRILTKQKKGPRINKIISKLSEDQVRTFSEVPSEFYEDILIEQGFARIELDNPVQGINYHGKLPASLHYPFVLAAPSSLCLFKKNVNKINVCNRECLNTHLILQHGQFDTDLIHMGNSQFYMNKQLPKSHNKIDRIIIWKEL